MKLASEDRTAGQRRFIGPLFGRCVQVARFVGIAWPTRSVSRTENCSTCCCGWMTLPGALGTWSDSPTSQPRRTSPGDFHGTGINGMRMVDSAQAMITVDRATPALPRFVDRRPRARMAPHEPFPDYREQRTAQTSPARVESQRPWSSRPVTDSRKAEPCVAVLGSVPTAVAGRRGERPSCERRELGPNARHGGGFFFGDSAVVFETLQQFVQMIGHGCEFIGSLAGMGCTGGSSAR